MKQIFSARGEASVSSSVQTLVDRHGAWRVLGQVLRTLVVRRGHRPAPTLDVLDDRLLRDIGLPPRREPPHWRDLR